MQGELLDTIEMTVPVLIVDPGIKDKKHSNIIRVMPLTFDTKYHCDGETYFLDSSGPTGFSCLVEIFNERPMLAGNRTRYKCSLSQADMEKIEGLLKRYRAPDEQRDEHRENASISDGADDTLADGADPEIFHREREAWREKEIALCDYLTDPVNESLQDVVHHVAVKNYKKAADDDGFVRVTGTVELMNNDLGKLLVIQKRDQMLLRYFSDQFEPGEMRMDDRPMAMKKGALDGEFEVEIGRVGQLPNRIDIALKINDACVEYPIVFDFPDENSNETGKDSHIPWDQNGSPERDEDDNSF